VGEGRAARRRAVTIAGHLGDTATLRAGLDDPDAGTRAAAVGAAARDGSLTVTDASAALADDDAAVRRRALEVCATGAAGAGVIPDVVGRLDDGEATVVEVAAWALGELGERFALPSGTVARLADVATGHDDPLVREAAVAALGALGDPVGLPAILAATTDRPAVRRRAVLALAPFEGPEVTAALERARADRDWQVRDAAELLLRPD
jgi:HEAT repeat protein